MNNFFNHIKNESAQVCLTHAEKSAMRLRLHVAMNPPLLTKSPYQWLLVPRTFVALSLVLLLMVGVGTTYAAENSLPQQPLYEIKVNLIEPLRVALATSVAAKAEVNADIAVERVKEAQTLAVQGKLDVATAQRLSDNFNAHKAQAIALAQESQPQEIQNNATTTATTTVTRSTSKGTLMPLGAASGQAIATTTATTTSASSTTTSSSTSAVSETEASSTSLVARLHTSLDIQAKVLDKLNSEAQKHANRDAKGEDRATIISAPAATSATSTPATMATSTVSTTPHVSRERRSRGD